MKAQPPLIQDPAWRFLLLAIRRALLTLCDAIKQVTSEPYDEEPRRVA